MSTTNPIEGGYCVKRLPDGRCIDVLRMAFNWRVVLTGDDLPPLPWRLVSRPRAQAAIDEENN